MDTVIIPAKLAGSLTTAVCFCFFVVFFFTSVFIRVSAVLPWLNASGKGRIFTYESVSDVIRLRHINHSFSLQDLCV